MASVQYTLAVEMEDGTKYAVTADQRDVSRWELEDFGTSALEMTSRIYTAYRYLAWAALFRTKQTKMPWPKFNELCVEARDAATDEGDAVDPGQPGQSDAD